MRYFECSRSLFDKMNYPWRSTQHASEDGQTTLCGRKILIQTTWGECDGGGQMCARCAIRLSKMAPSERRATA